MIRKLILLLAILSLTACKFDEVEKEMDLNQNPDIESVIYKEHFYERELFNEGEMATDVVNGNTIFEGSQVPVSTEKFPEPYYVSYTFNPNEEILDLAFILIEGMVADGEELLEDIFIYIEYAYENNDILTLTQENVKGKDVGYVGLFEEEWENLAEEYIEFVESTN